MSNWTPDDLNAIASTDDLHISPFREDGVTYGTPTWIWSVVVEGDLYVRGYNGTNSRWYSAAVAQEGGRIHAAGETYDVIFAKADENVNVKVDAAYRKKYAGSAYLPPMVAEGPRSATVKITPRLAA
jgi:hypothetical protein